MKLNHIAALALTALILVAALAPACSTPSGGGGSDLITPDRVYRIARLAAYGSATAMMMRDPGSGVVLAQARDGACELKAAEKWDLAALAEIAAKHGLGSQLGSSEGTLILTGLPVLLDAFQGSEFELGSEPLARAVVQGACDGLSLAIPASQPTFHPIPPTQLPALTQDAVATRPAKKAKK